MGVLKLSVIEEQLKEHRAKLRPSKKSHATYVGNCSCPCWAFLNKGEIVGYNDVASASSWNID